MTAKPTPKFSWELMDKLRLEKRTVARPENCITVAEYADKYKLNVCTARRQLCNIVKMGRLEKIKGKEVDAKNSVRSVTYYRIK